MKKLNLGCGEFKKEGYVNLDISETCYPDIVHNLETFPYPFDNDDFELIELNHLLEHLSEPFKVMSELHRLLKPEGLLVIRVPHFSRAMTHPQHKRGFDVTFPYYFDKNFLGGYTGVPFRCERMKLHWFAQKYLMKKMLHPFIYHLAAGTGIIIDLFANLSPILCSRVWCFWVGGFYEIEYVFNKEINENSLKS